MDRLGPHPGAATAGGQVGQVANPKLLAGPLGGLLMVKPEVTRQTKQILFLRGDLKVGDDIVATATSVWKVIKGS